MSVDSTSLERSTLERKDRAELATIAETLGRKPTSRAKKSDIVDLILELTGVTGDRAADEPRGAGSATPAADRAPEESSAEPAGRGQVEPVEGDERAGDGGSDTHEVDTGLDEGSSDEHDEHDEHDEQDDHNERESGDRQSGRDQPNDRQQQNGQNGQNGPNEHNQSDHDSAGQGGQGEGGQGVDGESGNRRRRRRRGRSNERPEGVDETSTWEGEPVDVEGLLDLREEGYGFLRVSGFLPSRDDVYVSVKQCRQLGLRKGDHIKGASRPAGRQEKNPALLRVDEVNGMEPDQARRRPRFEDLTPLFPDERLNLETPGESDDMTSRIIDLIAPIGKGQRGLIVSPPKAGKTTIMKTIAQSIERNNPDVHLMVLLVDERPEEVTDMRRSVQGEVIASTFDRPSDEHTAVAELTIERAKRLVEYGQDVVIVLDGITRLSRAYNLAAPGTGRVMSGGIDTGALYPPKRFFGAARNVEEGGSLTILASALVETGSKMDEVIFEEFKGTGNMELRLDRKMAERRIYPAIDVDASSTRHEELLFERIQLQQVWKLRRVLSGIANDGHSGASLELLMDRMKTFPTNAKFLAEMAKAPNT